MWRKVAGFSQKGAWFLGERSNLSARKVPPFSDSTAWSIQTTQGSLTEMIS